MTNDVKSTLLSNAYALILSWPEPEEDAQRAEQDNPTESEQPHEQ